MTYSQENPRDFESLLESLGQFNIYLGSSSTSTANSAENLISHLQSYTSSRKANRDFRLIPVGSPAIKAKIEELFKNLGIVESKWPLYFDPRSSVHQILMELKKKEPKNTKLLYLIKAIDQKMAWTKLQLLLIAIITIATVIVIILVPQVQAVLSAAVDITILGLIYTSSVALYGLKKNFYDDDPAKTRKAKSWDTAFLVINTVLNTSAYALWLASSALMTPLIAGLFITASIIEVVKEFHLGIENHKKYKPQSKPVYSLRSLSSAKDIYEQAMGNLRSDYEHLKHKRAALINLSGAFILTGLIATWCLIPGSTLVTISIVSALVIVQVGKNMFNKWNNSSNKKSLSIELLGMYNEYISQGPDSLNFPAHRNVSSVVEDNPPTHIPGPFFPTPATDLSNTPALSSGARPN